MYAFIQATLWRSLNPDSGKNLHSFKQSYLRLTRLLTVGFRIDDHQALRDTALKYYLVNTLELHPTFPLGRYPYKFPTLFTVQR